MASNNEDNTRLNLAHTLGSIYADDAIEENGEIVKYQRVKLVHGADGVNDGDVSTANPFPVGLRDTSGNALTSTLNPGTGGYVLNIHDPDIAKPIVNKYLSQDTATTSTLAVAAAVDDYTITVANGAVFTVGDYIKIDTTAQESTFAKITIIATNVLTLDRRLDNAHIIGDIVTKVIIDMATTGQTGTLAAPQIYMAGPPSGEVWHITRLLFTMVHGTAGDLGLFGNLTALTNGCLFRAYNDGAYRILTNWKSSADFKVDMYDVDFDSRSSGGGQYGTSGRGTFANAGTVLRLDGTTGDQIQLYVQDNITALDLFEMKIQGHVET